MNLFSISVKQISRNIFIYIVSVVLIAISIIIFNSTYSSIQTLFSELNFAYGFNDTDLYVSEPNDSYYNSFDKILTLEESIEWDEKVLDGYCKEMNLDIEKGSDEYYALLSTYDCAIRWQNQHHEELGGEFAFDFIDNFKDLLKQSDEECSPAFTYSFMIDPILYKECGCSSLSVIDYDIASRIKMNILKGKDLKDVSNTGNCLEAIAVGSESFADNVKIGDCFEISFFNFKKNEYEKFQVKIVGLLGSPYYAFGKYASFIGEDFVSLDKLIGRYAYGEEKNGGSFQLITLPFESFDTKDLLAGPDPIYYFTLKNSSEESINKLKHSLVSNGYDTISAKEVYQNTVDEIMKELLSDIVIVLLAFILSSLTICGTIILYIYDNYNMHYIMMLCGAKLKHHVSICVINTGIMCFASTVISIIYFLLSNYKRKKEYGEFFGINFDFNNLIITMGIVIISLLVSAVISSKVYKFTLYLKK